MRFQVGREARLSLTIDRPAVPWAALIAMILAGFLTIAVAYSSLDRFCSFDNQLPTKKAEQPFLKATRLSVQTRSFPSQPYGRFGFILGRKLLLQLNYM